MNLLGLEDDIVCFEYLKKLVWNFGFILIGIEMVRFENFGCLIEVFEVVGFGY